MKKYTVVLAVVFLFILVSLVSVFANDIVWDDIGRGNLNLRTVLVNLDNSKIIYVGSNNTILKTEDGGETWRNILSVKGQSRTLNFLLFNPQNKNSLYAATGGGLFYSHNQGETWSRVFQGKNYLENDCTTLAILSTTIYLGTKNGLLVSKDRGRKWHKERGIIGNSHILAIAYNLKEPDYIYVACVDGVFRTKNAGDSWERIFVAHSVEADNNNNAEDIIEDTDEERRVSRIRYISIDPNNLNCLYLATSRGVYKSQDRGENWELLSSSVLLNTDIKFLFISDNSNVYVVSRAGLFQRKYGEWQELSFHLTRGDIRFLAKDRKNNLYAACEKGLFKARIQYLNNEGRGNIVSRYSQNEPKISEVQQAAIKYAEVEPVKISRWRKEAARRAFLPRVSTGINRDTADLWHWESGSTTKTGDDILIRGKDTVGWDVTLTWDLGELIWNNDQTSIDVRSRLLVQLRDDILDEVTKLYFERIRVKMELDNLSIEDRKKRFEKELRLQELTAHLDALTGGYFSNQIKGKL